MTVVILQTMVLLILVLTVSVSVSVSGQCTVNTCSYGSGLFTEFTTSTAAAGGAPSSSSGSTGMCEPGSLYDLVGTFTTPQVPNKFLDNVTSTLIAEVDGTWQSDNYSAIATVNFNASMSQWTIQSLIIQNGAVIQSGNLLSSSVGDDISVHMIFPNGHRTGSFIRVVMENDNGHSLATVNGLYDKLLTDTTWNVAWAFNGVDNDTPCSIFPPGGGGVKMRKGRAEDCMGNSVSLNFTANSQLQSLCGLAATADTSSPIVESVTFSWND